MQVEVVQGDQVIIDSFGKANVLAHDEAPGVGITSELVGVVDFFKNLLAQSVKDTQAVVGRLVHIVNDQKIVHAIAVGTEEIVAQGGVVHRKSVRGQRNGTKGNGRIITGHKGFRGHKTLGHITTDGGITDDDPLVGRLAPAHHDNRLQSSIGNQAQSTSGVPADGRFSGYIALEDPKFPIGDGADVPYLFLHIKSARNGQGCGRVLKKIGTYGQGRTALRFHRQGPELVMIPNGKPKKVAVVHGGKAGDLGVVVLAGGKTMLHKVEVDRLIIGGGVHVALDKVGIVLHLYGNVQKDFASGHKLHIPERGDGVAPYLNGTVAIKAHQALVLLKGGIVGKVGVQAQATVGTAKMYPHVAGMVQCTLRKSAVGEQ